MNKRFLGGFIMGMILGAVGSVILMPESGRKLADKARNKAKEIARQIREKRQEVAEMNLEADEFLDHLVDSGNLTDDQADEVSKLLKKFAKNKK